MPFIIAIAVSSNLQGAATLVGDTTAIMLGSALDMSFVDFFWYRGKPGMFFAVELDAILSPLKEIDFETIGLLLGLFLMIGGISEQGVIDAAANLLAKTGGGNIFLLYTVIVWASVLISAFIDNIPYVATMIPVIAGLASALNVDPTVFYFGLLSGATLGGNCTPIGASANITGIGILRKEGYIVKNTDFK